MPVDYQPLLGLIAAHLINDFALQRESWTRDRYESGLASRWLYIHGSLAGILSYLFAGDLACPMDSYSDST
jgi:hypothetical protein